MSLKDKIFKIFVPLLIVAAGFIGMQVMVQSKPAPKKEVKMTQGVLVEAVSVKSVTTPVTIPGTGTVVPAQEAGITPQVSGKVVYMEKKFRAGGFFKKGELLFRIEDTDYRLAIDRARAELARADYEYRTVESQAQVARTEWERLKLQGKGDPNPLVLYEPQLENARANVESAKAALKQAELDLQRTSLYAPFNCLVRSEEVDLGQFIQRGNKVATVAGTDSVEIEVPLTLEDLEWVRVPRGDSVKGSPVRVNISIGGRTMTWKGAVVRSLGEVDPRGRMARIVISVHDPYGLQGGNGEKTSLEIGMFVEVEIQGKRLSRVFAIPRSALRDRDTVWVIAEGGVLHIEPVKIVRRDRDRLYVKNGLSQGDLVILTNITGASEGMRVRLMSEDEGT